ncbi:MAG: hypothetical protein AB7I30_22400 [Isosphaeraceae bacterium]
MKLSGVSHRVEAIPFPDRAGPTLVGLEARFADGVVKGKAEDREFRVGGDPTRLSQIRGIQTGMPAVVELDDRRRLKGELAGLDRIPLEVGGQRFDLDLTKANAVLVDASDRGTTISCTVVARRNGEEVGRATAPIHLKGSKHASLVAIREGTFITPPRSAVPVSHLRFVSSPGDFIGQGKTYAYGAEDLTIGLAAGGVNIQVDGWSIEFAGPGRAFLEAREYRGAKRTPFRDESPGINLSGNGRGCNKIDGAFVVWELELKGNEVTRLAIDFVQRCEERMPPLYGSLRYNSTYH